MEELRRQNQSLLDQLRLGQGQVRSLLRNLWHSPSDQHQLTGSSHFLPMSANLDTNTQRLFSQTKNLQEELAAVRKNSVKHPVKISSKEKTPVKIKLVEATKSPSDMPLDRFDSFDSRLTDDLLGGLDSLDFTPVQTANRSTPKSILKRRNIIDRNIHLDSEMSPFSHPANGKSQRLQWSHKLCDSKPMYTDLYFNGSGKQKATRKDRMALYPFPTDTSTDHSLMEDPGNLRSSMANEKSRQKQLASYTHNRAQGFTRSQDDRPLLGYDWIAADLDNTGSVLDYNDSFFDDIREFRSRNRDDCQDKFNSEKMFSWFIQPPPEVKPLSHTCVHGYILNDRLYPEPINPDEEGNSVCPVCLTERQVPTPQSPSYVRISIPKSALTSPHRLKPHRRKSYDATDKISLSSHCMAGWDSCIPAIMATASTMDLKQAINGITEKLITEDGANKDLIESLASMGKQLVSFHGNSTVLDMHRSLLFELDTQNKTLDNTAS